MCLDPPEKVTRASIHDIIPQHYLLNHLTRDWGRFSWHWFFNIQPEPFPEKMMGADPDWFIQKKLAKTPQGLEFFGKEALAEYMRCFRDPDTIHAICEDYRAAFGPGPVPRVTGVAASSDTDQTLGSATAWFGDFRLEAR